MAVLSRSSGHRRRRGTADQLAVLLLAVAIFLPQALPGSSQTALDEPLQWARAATQTYQSHWKDTSDTKGAEMDKPAAGGSRHDRGLKSGAGGYNPQRVRRFWSHYHGARPGPKEKPLEKQPREK